MTYPLKGLVLHLHSALANGGKSKGSNIDQVLSWYDLTNKGHSGTLAGYSFMLDRAWTGTNIQSDPFSLYFNGLSNSVVVPSSVDLLPSDSGFTFETWVRPAKTGYIVSYGGETERGFSLFYDSDNSELRAQVRTGSKSMSFVFSDIELKAWQHVTVLYDGARLWGILNAAPQGFSVPSEGSYVTTSSDLTLGSVGNSDNGFEGSIATFRVYNRGLDWEEVSDSYNSGFIITDEYKDLKSNGLVLWRDDLQSSLNISIMSYMRGQYETAKVADNNLTSTLSVAKFNDLGGSVDVNPVAYMRADYGVMKYGGSHLSSFISVSKHDSIPSSLSINPVVKMLGHYSIQEIYLSELQSEITISSYPSNLKSYLTVDLREVTAKAHYDIERLVSEDLESTIDVNSVADLKSTVGVNVGTDSFIRSRYDVDGIEVEDLVSTLDVNSVSDLTSNVKVATQGYMVARYGTSGIIIEDLPSSLIVLGTSDLKSKIGVGTQSGMTASYGVAPIFSDDLPMVVGVKQFDELYGEMFIKLYTNMTARYDVSPIYFDWLPSQVTVREVNDLPSRVIVTKEVVLRAGYDLIERPKFTQKIYPNKDAFVREFFPRLNYGSETQMYTGKAGAPFPEVFRSLVGFDVSRIPTDNKVVGKATLRLYYDGRGQGTQQVQVLQPDTQWTETGVTWANQPNFVQGFSAVADVGGDARYIEFDVTELVKGWHESSTPNFGMLIKAVDETAELQRGFYTKEAIEHRPELEVTYYDMQVYSEGYVNLLADVTVMQSKTKDLTGKLNIRNNNSKYDVSGNLHVYNPREIESFIWINRPQIKGSISARRRDFKEIPAELVVRQKQVGDLIGTIAANEIEKPSSIYVLYRDDIESSITARRNGDPDTDGGQMPSFIGVSEVNKSSSIYVLYRDDLLSDLDIRVWADSGEDQNNLLIEFEITRSFELHGEIEVMERVQLDSSIDIRVEDNTDQPSSVYVRYRDDLVGYGNIGNPRLKSSIEVWEKSLLVSELTVRHTENSDLESNIYVPVGDWSEIPSTVQLRRMKDVPGTVIVLSGNLQSFLTIPINGQRDLRSFVDSRVRRVSDLVSELGINSGNLYSEIGVRIGGHRDFNGTIRVRRTEDSSLPIEGYLRQWLNLPSSISASKPRYNEIYSEMAARQSDKEELVGDLAVRVWGDPDTDGGQIVGDITVKADGESNLESDLSVRRDDLSELPSDADVKQVSDLSTDIIVRQFRNEDLHSSVAVYELYELYCDGIVRQWGDPETEGGQIPSDITVRQYEEKDLNGLVEVYEHSSIDGDITVRRWNNPFIDGGQLRSSLAVRRIGTKDTVGTITARQKDTSDLRTTVFAVRRSDLSDLPVNALIKRVSDLEGNIEVVTAYPYAYIM